jgi:sugar-specific transcriptional regulator TrmB
LISNDEANEQILTLTELGLTTTQAKVYLALAKSKNLTAQSISRLSSVSRPDVYRVLSQLQNAGIVEKIIAKPEEFRAIRIEETVSLLLQRRTRKTQSLQEMGQKLVQDFKKTVTTQPAPTSKGEFIFIPGKRTAYARSERMLKGLQNSLLFVGLTNNMSAWLTRYFSSIEAAFARNIDCRFIMPKSDDITLKGPFCVLQKYPNFKVKTIEGVPKASFSIWDKNELLITTSIVDTPFSTATLWSNNKSLIDLCADYFECLWAKAKEI